MSAVIGEVPRRPRASAQVNAPTRPATATAASSATPCQSPALRKAAAVIPPTTANMPWAKLTTPVTR